MENTWSFTKRNWQKTWEIPHIVVPGIKKKRQVWETIFTMSCYRKAEIRALKQRYRAPLKEPLIFLYVRTKLRDEKWSPETISGRLSIDYPRYTIDDETIYRYIYGRKQRRMKLWNNLLLHRKKRMKKDGRKVKAFGRLPEAIPIRERPGVINSRLRPGDWETDNMEGKRSDDTVVSVTVDRMTRITRIRKLDDHTAQSKADSLIIQLKKEHPLLRESLTIDRGSENSNHKIITDLHHIPVYACDSYHSWEKGSVENMIGRIRRYIPKGRSVDGISQERLNIIEDKLNNWPRKILGFFHLLTSVFSFLKIALTIFKCQSASWRWRRRLIYVDKSKFYQTAF